MAKSILPRVGYYRTSSANPLRNMCDLLRNVNDTRFANTTLCRGALLMSRERQWIKTKGRVSTILLQPVVAEATLRCAEPRSN
jgi:hypothetical protein